MTPISHTAAAVRTDQDGTLVHPVGQHRFWSHLPNVTLTLLRVVAGLLFMQHGIQKFFGAMLPAGQPPMPTPEMFSQIWFAGALELVGGALIVIGLFTRITAFLLSGEMAVAYFQAHAPQGFWPAANGGELAVLYCFIFLFFAAVGGGRFSLDHLLSKRHARHERQTMVEEVPAAR